MSDDHMGRLACKSQKTIFKFNLFEFDSVSKKTEWESSPPSLQTNQFIIVALPIFNKLASNCPSPFPYNG